jgi:hypothetical protein
VIFVEDVIVDGVTIADPSFPYARTADKETETPDGSGDGSVTIATICVLVGASLSKPDSNFAPTTVNRFEVRTS